MKVSSKRVGLGTVTAKLIGGVVVILPEPIQRRVRSCGGCAKRQAALDKAVPNLNPFATKPPQPQPPTI